MENNCETKLTTLDKLDSDSNLFYTDVSGVQIPVKAVPDGQERMNVLPDVFGDVLIGIHFESAFFNYMATKFKGYSGGHFEVFQADDNNMMFYIIQGEQYIVNVDYQGEQQVSSLVASFAAGMMLGSHFSFYLTEAHPANKKAIAAACTIYHGLREISHRLSEEDQRLLFKIID